MKLITDFIAFVFALIFGTIVMIVNGIVNIVEAICGVFS